MNKIGYLWQPLHTSDENVWAEFKCQSQNIALCSQICDISVLYETLIFGGKRVKYILVHRFCRPLLDIPGCSHKNGCFGWVYGRAQLKPIGKTSSAPQWVGASAPRRRPPHPQARWSSFSYLLSSLLLLSHKSISETLRPHLPAPHQRSHQTPPQCLRKAKTEWTLGSLAFSSRSRNQSQCGVRSPSSKVIDQQTLVVEGGGKQCRKRRSRRETLTQGLKSSVGFKICKKNMFQVLLQAEAEACVGGLYLWQKEETSRWEGRVIKQHQVYVNLNQAIRQFSRRFFGLFKPKPKPRPVSRPHCGSCCYTSSSHQSSSSSSHHHQQQSSAPVVQSNSNHQSSSGSGCRCLTYPKSCFASFENNQTMYMCFELIIFKNTHTEATFSIMVHSNPTWPKNYDIRDGVIYRWS